MPKQPAFPGLRDAMKKKVTRRELFLAEMDAVVPWTRLLALIEPHYPKERLKNLPLSALSGRLGHRHEEPCRCRNSPPFPVFVMR